MRRKTSVDHSGMRDRNLALILKTLHKNAPLSRAALANQTGLNKATVSSMVKYLLDQGFAKELGIDPTSTDVGRPAINLEPAPEAGYFIGVEVGVDFILIIIADFAVNIVSRRYESTLKLQSQDAVIHRLLVLLQESVAQIKSRNRPLFGIGIGIPGLVDVNEGKLLFAPNLGWQDVPLKAIVQAQFNTPVFVANEANLATLGESTFGAGTNSNYMLYVNSGVGIGGGIVINGRLLHGATGFAGEIGHMTVVRNGLPCNCGNTGCWETVADLRSLFRRIQQGQSSWIANVIGDEFNRLSLPIILEAAQHNDPVVLEALRETGEWLGIGIASILNIINPTHVVFGGTLSTASPYLLPAIKETVQQRTWSWVQKDVEIVAAAHGEDGVVFGGVAIVFENVINHPRGWSTIN